MKKLFSIAALIAIMLVPQGSEAMGPVVAYLLAGIGSRAANDIFWPDRQTVHPSVSPSVDILDNQGRWMGSWLPEHGQQLLVLPETNLVVKCGAIGGELSFVEFLPDGGKKIKVDKPPFAWKTVAPSEPGAYMVQVHPDLKGKRNKDGWAGIRIIVVDPEFWRRAVTDEDFRAQLAGISGTMPRIPVNTIVSTTGEEKHGIGRNLPPSLPAPTPVVKVDESQQKIASLESQLVTANSAIDSLIKKNAELEKAVETVKTAKAEEQLKAETKVVTPTQRLEVASSIIAPPELQVEWRGTDEVKAMLQVRNTTTQKTKLYLIMLQPAPKPNLFPFKGKTPEELNEFEVTVSVGGRAEVGKFTRDNRIVKIYLEGEIR